jgi:inositol 3-alpha-galactosyltransferase
MSISQFTGSKFAWVTLLTRQSYLPGVILLAYSLRKHGSKYPLIVQITESAQESINVLKSEGQDGSLLINIVEPILPARPVNLVAERFADTWTKLRAFQLVEYERVIFLDADILIMQNMDELFNFGLPEDDWIAANHMCVCNLDNDPWAAPDWNVQNCGFTPMKHPLSLHNPTVILEISRPTYHLLNSGVFLFKPSKKLFDEIMQFLETTPLLDSFAFPDQDLLTEFFRNRWVNFGWQYNAIKTMRYWHPQMWRDDQVKALHFIVDKPWQRRIGSDGVAGYLGRDGETHTWWWNEYKMWRREVLSRNEEDILAIVEMNVDK